MRRRTGPGIVALALCLGGALTACGGSGESDVALGAAGSGPDRAPTAAVPPQGKVSLAPLDGNEGPAGDGATGAAGKAPRQGASGPTAGPEGGSDARSGPGGTPANGTGGAVPSGSGGPQQTPGSDGTPGGSPAPAPSTPAPAPSYPEPGPTGPAVLQLGEPVREALDRRWCEKVTVEFRNTGGTAAVSGTVTFATHIIGALGVDWATRESSQPLPAPIPPGAVRKQAYTVCVDAWRVPLGMHIETQDVTAAWK
ncbi:hypothetical protein GLX30_18565 [Streptomyces sp. Tu 2975]|uniref:hypothetical protein n=1 Tax=Streptomyces sp. Tu 2975 TaxID=2676871 RepID=UPI0013596B2F|nr:hypothetical protein [Streptomyces sp. Tu 2975]QIP85707.1 hypothetical protein GLX30_18565 [Streptomyces sp. Tu 2975]